MFEGQDALTPVILPLLSIRMEALRQAAALTKELVRRVKPELLPVPWTAG